MEVNMRKCIKLIILIVISLSVYFIYQDTKNSNIKILSIGDSLALGINSYGSKEYGYIDYYKDYLVSKNKKVTITNKDSKKDLTIQELLEKIKTHSELKKSLIEAHIVIISIGYNDLLYKLGISEKLSIPKMNQNIKEIEKEYEKLIKEIRKYYKNEIIMIGCHKTNREDYYLNIGIRKLNNYLQQQKEIQYIDTYKLLNNFQKYFSNPNSYYPNQYGYKKIAEEIIKKSLEKTKNI